MENNKAKQIVVKATKEWGDFHHIPFNRPVRDVDVKHLEESVKRVNDLHLHPIVVNPEMGIIDGQHRLQVAKNLDLPIYYLVDYNYTPEKIMITNSYQKMWNIDNYVDYWEKSGVEAYIRIKKYKEKYGDLTYMILLEWLTNLNRSQMVKDLKEGKLILNLEEKGLENLDNAFVIINKLKERNFKPTKIYSQKFFYRALRKIIRNPFVDINRFHEKFEQYPYNFQYQTNFHDNLTQLVNIYNFKIKKDILKIIKSQTRVDLEL